MIRKFIASSVDKAQQKARRALGERMVVIGVRDLPSGDVEVIASNEAGAQAYREANPPAGSDDTMNQSNTESYDHKALDHQNNTAGHDDSDESNLLSQHDPEETPSKSEKKSFFFRRKKNNPEKKSSDRKEPIVTEPSHEEVTVPPTDLPTDITEPNITEENEILPMDLKPEDMPVGEDPGPHHLPNDDGQMTASTKPTPLKPPSHGEMEQAPIHHPHSEPSPLTHETTRARSQPYPSLTKPGGSRLHEPLEQKFSENALENLRNRLTGQHQSYASYTEDPATASLQTTLKSHGIGERLTSAILNSARKAPVDDDLYRLGMGLTESFNFSPLRSTAAIPIMLVGPTGAGKTSCAAKLTAIALSEGDTAMMITTDTGRAGALEQFATYGEKLQIDCYGAETPEEISTIMQDVKPQGAVILDTPGISPYDAGDLAALKSFQTSIGAEPVLVLPASGDVGEYIDWAHAFRAFGVRCCIVTKFDATKRVGAGLTAAFEGEMTLTYFSETPFISEGLLPASPEFLAYRLTANYPGRIAQS